MNTNTTSHLRRKSKAVKDTMTPPMLRSSSESSFDESYFDKTYVPLSSLPTPPLSHSRTNSRQQSPDTFSPDEILDPDLLGPAIHLTNLIPTSTSLTSPSIPLVHSILTHTDLPLETLALAVCILDSLNTRFALSWCQSFPLQITSLPPPFSSPSSFNKLEYQHIDEIHPEIIVLCAMILAVKFLDDHQQSTKEYREEWGRGIWSCEQINFTQRAILENLGYRLLPLWDERLILEALVDMERAGRQYEPEPEIYNDDEENEQGLEERWNHGNGGYDSLDSNNSLMVKTGGGKAVMGLGNQITPVETPREENCKGTRDVNSETRSAFRGQRKDEGFDLEPFPAFMEDGRGGYGF